MLPEMPGDLLDADGVLCGCGGHGDVSSHDFWRRRSEQQASQIDELLATVKRYERNLEQANATTKTALEAYTALLEQIRKGGGQ